MSDKVRKNILFNQKRDQDILEFLALQDNQSGVVRAALRLYMAQGGSVPYEITLDDVMAEIGKLQGQISNIKVVSGNGAEREDEPQDVANKLKNFGKF